jgi:sec-independent protein translocase protein TatC
MATALRKSVKHEDQLSLVEHLDELRSRLIVCVLALVVCFGFTFWQNEAILDAVNAPLQDTQQLDGTKEDSADPLEQAARYQVQTGAAFRAAAAANADAASAYRDLARRSESAADREAYGRLAAAAVRAQRSAAQAAAAVPTSRERLPVTLGVAEPFTTTVTVAFWAALLLALPIVLWQAYAFILPAFAPGEKRIALPLMWLVPFLFAGGVAFGYLVVLPRAIGFLQNFNDDDFDILIQARDYYKFAIMFVGGIGILFQIPIAVLAITRLAIMTPRQLQSNAGYVLLVLAVLAAVVTPTPDPLTMLLALVPLFALFELSILLSAWLNRVSPPGSWWGEMRGEDQDDDELYAKAYDDED